MAACRFINISKNRWLSPFIRVINFTATSPRSAGVIVGLPEAEVSDVILENVHISAPRGLTIRNAKKVILKDVKIETQQGEPFILENAEVEGIEAETP